MKGPRSFLSICSKPGIQWVSEKTGNYSFQDSAFLLTKVITRSLKIEKQLPGERAPDPSFDVAWRYATSKIPHTHFLH